MSQPRTFDGTSGQLGYEPAAEPAYTDGPKYDDREAAPSMLDALVSQVNQQETEAPLEVRLSIPNVQGVRIVCRRDVSFEEFEGWQKLAIPRDKRKNPSPLDVKQNVLTMLAITQTAKYLELFQDGEWRPVTNNAGDVLDFTSRELMSQFNQLQPQGLVRKLFGEKNEGHMIRAGMKVIAAAGFSTEDDEREALDEAKEDAGVPLA
jgi:hypothetical protein